MTQFDRSRFVRYADYLPVVRALGRTPSVRRGGHVWILGDEIDRFVGDLPGLASATVHVQDIDRDRGYSTTAERKKQR